MGAFDEINSTLKNPDIIRRAPAALVESLRIRLNEIAQRTPLAGQTITRIARGGMLYWHRSDGYETIDTVEMLNSQRDIPIHTAERARLSEELKQSLAYQRLLNLPQTWTGERAPFQSFRSSDGVGIGKDRFTHGSFDFFQNILRRVDEL